MLKRWKEKYAVLAAARATLMTAAAAAPAPPPPPPPLPLALRPSHPPRPRPLFGKGYKLTSSQVQASQRRNNDRASMLDSSKSQLLQHIANETAAGRVVNIEREVASANVLLAPHGLAHLSNSIRKDVREGKVGTVDDPAPANASTVPSQLLHTIQSWVESQQLDPHLGDPNARRLNAVLDAFLASNTAKNLVSREYLKKLWRRTFADTVSMGQPSRGREARRMEWLTASNLLTWLEGWKDFLVVNGFATAVESTTFDGKLSPITIKPEALPRIINFDETILPLDLEGDAGGSRVAMYYNKSLPRGARPVILSSRHTTLIVAVDSSGRLHRLRVIFNSSGKDPTNFAVKASWISDLPVVQGDFGSGMKSWTTVVSVTSNGSMDTHNFAELLGYS